MIVRTAHVRDAEYFDDAVRDQIGVHYNRTETLGQ